MSDYTLAESFLNLPDLPGLDLSKILDLLTQPFDDIKDKLDGYVDSGLHLLEIVDRFDVLVPGLDAEIKKFIALLKIADGFLHKQPEA